VDVNHPIIAKTFKTEVNSQVKGIVEKQLAKKRPSVFNNAIYLFFGVKDLFEKDDV
jgi:elongation factor P hydroxylase